MDEVKEEKKEFTMMNALFEIKDIMIDHNITADQALFLLCKLNNIEYDSDLGSITSLYNKGLIVKNKVNVKLLYHTKKPEQLTLDIPFTSKPNGTEFTLDRAHRIEKEFVADHFSTDEERKHIADKYFRGDTILARYFIIFKSLFPVKHTKSNAKWNKKFGFTYEGISLWDSKPSVAKKFIEIYKKLDIGIFLEATYRCVRDSIDLEQGKCFMTKPYKFLGSFDSYYREVQLDIEKKVKRNKDDTEKKMKELGI